jgi:hypothetical protein
MLSLFYRQDLRDKEIEGKQRRLVVCYSSIGRRPGVCVFHYPSLVMDGVFNFCGTRLFYYFLSFTDGGGKKMPLWGTGAVLHT